MSQAIIYATFRANHSWDLGTVQRFIENSGMALLNMEVGCRELSPAVRSRLIEASDEVWNFGVISDISAVDLEMAMKKGKNIKFFDIKENESQISEIGVSELEFGKDVKNADNTFRRLKEYDYDMGSYSDFIEIERKWILNKVPTGFPLIIDAVCEQAYLSTSPEVRIRKRTETGNVPLFFLDIKNDGILTRSEITNPISEEKYKALKAMLEGKPIIRKKWNHFDIGNNQTMEVTIVDPGTDTEFIYAEVEFKTREESELFVFPIKDAVEVTSDPNYKMKNYWKRTRIEKAG